MEPIPAGGDLRAPWPQPNAIRRFPTGLFVAILVLASLPMPVAAQAVSAESGLTLEQALTAAQARSPALVAQDAAATAARQRAVAAGQLPDPMLRAGIENLPVDGPDRFSPSSDFMTMRSIGLMQQFTRMEKRQAQRERFERHADVAQAARLAQLTLLRREVAQAWLDRHYRERMIELLRSRRQEASLQSEAAEAAFRAGRGSEADIFSARTAVAELDNRIRGAETDRANATVALARWVGDLASKPLAGFPVISTIRLGVERLPEAVEQHHPELGLLAKQEAVALAEAEVARQELRPDWSVELMYSQRGPAFSNMVSIGVSVPLQLDRANRQDRELAARLALVEQIRAERDEATRQRLSETQRWVQTWRGNREQIARYDRSILPLAAERTRAALAAYRAGKEPLDAVLRARRTEIDTRMERVRLEMDTAALWAKLEYLLPDGHQEPDVASTWKEREITE